MVEEAYFEGSISLLTDIKHMLGELIGAKQLGDTSTAPPVGIPNIVASTTAGQQASTNYHNSVVINDTSSVDGINTFLDKVGSLTPESVEGFTSIITNMSEKLATIDKGQAEESATSITLLGDSLLKFSKSAAISTPLMLIGLPGLMLAVPSIKVLALTSSSIDSDSVRDGSRNIIGMGASLLVFSGSLALSSLALSVVDYESVGKGVLAIGALAVTYALVGKFNKNILMGSLGVLAMGATMLLLTPSVVFMSSAIAENPHSLWQLPLMIGGLGATYALVGAGLPLVAAGALAVGAIGAGLLVLAAGLGSVYAIEGMTAERSMEVADSIKYTLKGFSEGFRSMSALDAVSIPLKLPAVFAMTSAVISLSTAVDAYGSRASNWTNQDTDTLKYTISGLSEAFATAGSESGMSKLFGFNVGKNDVERGVKSVRYMGDTLVNLSEGIVEWRAMGLDATTMKSITGNVSLVLNAIPGVFASIGARERGSTTDLDLGFGLIVKSPFGKGDVSAGIKSVRYMGDTLASMVDGISAWKTLKLSPEDMATIASNVNMVLDTIPWVFASIGQREKGTVSQSSFFGLTFTSPFAKGDVTTGISSVSKLGDTLKSLYEGIEAWKTGGSQGVTSEVIADISSNIEQFLFSIPKSFAAVGKMESDTEGILFGQGDVNKGVDIINELVPSLTKITDIIRQLSEEGVSTDGLGAFGDSIPALIESIAADEEKVELLSSMVDPFARFVDTLSKYVDVTKKYLKVVDTTNVGKLDSHIKWVESLVSIGDVNPAVLSANVSSYASAYGSGMFIPANMNATGGRGVPFVETKREVNNIYHQPAKAESNKPTQKKKDEPTNEEVMQQVMQLVAMLSGSMESINTGIMDLNNHMKSGVIRTKEVGDNALF